MPGACRVYVATSVPHIAAKAAAPDWSTSGAWSHVVSDGPKLYSTLADSTGSASANTVAVKLFSSGPPTAIRVSATESGIVAEDGGALTVVATGGPGSHALRWATTRIVLEPGGKVSRSESGTLGADRLS